MKNRMDEVLNKTPEELIAELRGDIIAESVETGDPVNLEQLDKCLEDLFGVGIPGGN